MTTEVFCQMFAFCNVILNLSGLAEIAFALKATGRSMEDYLLDLYIWTAILGSGLYVLAKWDASMLNASLYDDFETTWIGKCGDENYSIAQSFQFFDLPYIGLFTITAVHLVDFSS